MIALVRILFLSLFMTNIANATFSGGQVPGTGDSVDPQGVNVSDSRAFYEVMLDDQWAPQEQNETTQSGNIWESMEKAYDKVTNYVYSKVSKRKLAGGLMITAGSVALIAISAKMLATQQGGSQGSKLNKNNQSMTDDKAIKDEVIKKLENLKKTNPRGFRALKLSLMTTIQFRRKVKKACAKVEKMGEEISKTTQENVSSENLVTAFCGVLSRGHEMVTMANKVAEGDDQGLSNKFQEALQAEILKRKEQAKKREEQNKATQNKDDLPKAPTQQETGFLESNMKHIRVHIEGDEDTIGEADSNKNTGDDDEFGPADPTPQKKSAVTPQQTSLVVQPSEKPKKETSAAAPKLLRVKTIDTSDDGASLLEAIKKGKGRLKQASNDGGKKKEDKISKTLDLCSPVLLGVLKKLSHEERDNNDDVEWED